MTEPRTAAGRRLLAWGAPLSYTNAWFLAAILDIEAEAARARLAGTYRIECHRCGQIGEYVLAIEAEAVGGATEAMFHAGTEAGERVGRHKALLAIEALVPTDGRGEAGHIEHPDEWSFTLPEVRDAIRALPDD